MDSANDDIVQRVHLDHNMREDMLDTLIVERLDYGNCNARSEVKEPRTIQREDNLPYIGCYTLMSEEE